MKRRDQKILAKNMCDTSPRMVLNRVSIINFLDSSVNTFSGSMLNDASHEFYYNLAKTIMKAKLNGKLYETAFKEGAIEDNPMHVSVNTAASACLAEAEFLDDFLDNYLPAQLNNMKVAVLCSFTYSAPCKDDLGLMDGDSLDYNFIVCAVCDMVSSYGSYRIDFEKSGNAESVSNDSPHIIPKPVDGFIYPSFHDGFSDVNHILFYMKKPGDDLLTMYADLFGAKYVMCNKTQRESFDCIIRDIFGEKLTYAVYVNIISALEALRTNYDPAEDDAEITPAWIHEVAHRILGDNCPDYENICEIVKSYTCGMTLYCSGVFSKEINITGDGITVKSDCDHTSAIGVGKCTDGFQLSAYTGEDVSIGNTKLYG